MALDQTPYIDPRTEPDPHPPEVGRNRTTARNRKTDAQPQAAAGPRPVEGLDPQKDANDDCTAAPPPHFV